LNKNISNTFIKTEKEYKSYFDQGMLGMAKTSLEKGWLEANSVILNMFGYSREEFFELTWDKMTYPDDLEKDLLQFKRVQANEIDSYSIDKRFFRKNGDIFHASLTVNAVRKTDDSIDYMIAILSDITERKKANTKLMIAKKKYEDLSNLLPVAIYEVDLEGKFNYVNNKAFEYFGYNDDIYNGNFNVLQMIVPEDRDRAKDAIQDIIVKRIYKNNEYTGIRKDGSRFPILIFSNLILKDNKPAGIRGVVVDLTERKKTEQALKESEEKFRSFIDENKAIILEIDPSTNKILIANKAAVDFYGYSKAEIIDKNMADINVLSAEEIKKIVNKAVNHKVDIFHFKHKLANNEIRDIEGYPSPVKVGDKTHLLVIIFDVTERKKAEEALKNNEAQLKEINITKDKFFSIIAHDLKSPFNAILGFSKILLEGHKEYDTQKREEMISYVNTSAIRAFKLLENLLTWSRSHSGNIPFMPEELYLKTLLIETLYNQEGQANKKNIKVTETIHANELIFVDENMIATILRNLISNAIKFTPKNGNIVISSKKQVNSEQV